jgi:hypothetical protein
MATETQRQLFSTIVENSYLCMHVVLGSAGVSQSFLMDLLRLKYTLLGFTVVAVNLGK